MKQSVNHVRIERLDTNEKYDFLLMEGKEPFTIQGSDNFMDTGFLELSYGNLTNVSVFSQNDWSGQFASDNTSLIPKTGHRYWTPVYLFSNILPTKVYYTGSNVETDKYPGQIRIGNRAVEVLNFPYPEDQINSSVYNATSGILYVGTKNTGKVMATIDNGATWTEYLDLQDISPQYTRVKEMKLLTINTHCKHLAIIAQNDAESLRYGTNCGNILTHWIGDYVGIDALKVAMGNVWTGPPDVRNTLQGLSETFASASIVVKKRTNPGVMAVTGISSTAGTNPITLITPPSPASMVRLLGNYKAYRVGSESEAKAYLGCSSLEYRLLPNGISWLSLAVLYVNPTANSVEYAPYCSGASIPPYSVVVETSDVTDREIILENEMTLTNIADLLNFRVGDWVDLIWADAYTTTVRVNSVTSTSVFFVQSIYDMIRVHGQPISCYIQTVSINSVLDLNTTINYNQSAGGGCLFGMGVVVNGLTNQIQGCFSSEGTTVYYSTSGMAWGIFPANGYKAPTGHMSMRTGHSGIPAHIVFKDPIDVTNVNSTYTVEPIRTFAANGGVYNQSCLTQGVRASGSTYDDSYLYWVGHRLGESAMAVHTCELAYWTMNRTLNDFGWWTRWGLWDVSFPIAQLSTNRALYRVDNAVSTVTLSGYLPVNSRVGVTPYSAVYDTGKVIFAGYDVAGSTTAGIYQLAITGTTLTSANIAITQLFPINNCTYPMGVCYNGSYILWTHNPQGWVSYAYWNGSAFPQRSYEIYNGENTTMDVQGGCVFDSKYYFVNPTITNVQYLDLLIVSEGIKDGFGLPGVIATGTVFPLIFTMGLSMAVESNEAYKTYLYTPGVQSDTGVLTSSNYSALTPGLNKLWLYCSVLVNKWLTNTGQSIRIEVSYDDFYSFYYLPTFPGGTLGSSVTFPNANYEINYTNIKADKETAKFYFPYNTKQKQIAYRITLVKGTVAGPIVQNIALFYVPAIPQEIVFPYTFQLNDRQQLIDRSIEVGSHTDKLKFLTDIWKDNIMCRITHVDGVDYICHPFKPKQLPGGGLNITYQDLNDKVYDKKAVGYIINMPFKNLFDYN